MLQELTQKLMAGQNFTEAGAEQALQFILAEETPDAAIASFLTAQTIKGETAQELAGFARIMRGHAVSVNSAHPKIIDTCGTGGGANTFNISTAAGFVIAGAGLPVAKHGNRAMTSHCGSADVLQALGVRIEAPPQLAEQCLNEFGLAFMFAPLFHPSMKRVAQIRRHLGHRTIFNLLGPLTNPASASYQIVGVYSPNLTDKVAQALSILGCHSAWVVHSNDGLDELSIGASTQVSAVTDSGIENFQFSPQEVGFPRTQGVGFLRGGTSKENAEMIRGILTGRIRGPVRDVVVLNTAAALYVAGEGDFSETISKAEKSIDSGAALDKLTQLIRAYSRFPT